MVVAEVSKSFQQFDKILGEHRWVEFLQKSSTEERERKTRVYYSTYSNGRALQKDGAFVYRSCAFSAAKERRLEVSPCRGRTLCRLQTHQ